MVEAWLYGVQYWTEAPQTGPEERVARLQITSLFPKQLNVPYCFSD